MPTKGYKKYMKKSVPVNDYPLVKIFLITFFGMLLVFTILIKSFSPSVDVSIGDYKTDNDVSDAAVNIDGRLAALQDEDRGRSFRELMKDTEDSDKNNVVEPAEKVQTETPKQENVLDAAAQEPMYKVYIGSYSSSEQAKVAKDIILESGANLNPIVKCIGSNNYTLQVGIFKNRQGADALLYTVQQNHLPGRVVKEY